MGAALACALAAGAGCGDGGGGPAAGGQSGDAGAAGASGNGGSATAGGNGGGGGDAGSSAGAAGAGSGGDAGSAGEAGSSGAGASGGSSGGPDAGLPEPLVVGDVLPGNASTALSGDAPEGDGRETACLHVDLLLGEYVLVPGDTPTDETFEPVARFVKGDGGFEAFGFFPWNYDFVVPETPTQYLPEDEETVLDFYDGNWRLEVAFRVTDSSVDMIRVVVAEAASP